MARVLILGAGPLQVPAIRVAKEEGFEVICVDMNPSAIGFSFADSSHVVSTMDFDGVLALAKRLKVDYVFTSTSDAPVRTAAWVSERLGLPTGINYEDACCATQKDRMRARLSDFDVPMPLYYACGNFREFADAVERLECRCIVKPSDCAASRGVKLLEGRLESSFLKDIFNETITLSREGVVMVEEYVEGSEVSVESVTIKGETRVISITDKMVTEPPYFVELGHCEPSRLSDDTRRSIVEVAKKTVSAIGIVNGVSHTEVKVTSEGPKVIETAARLGGDFITSKLVPLSTGIDLVRQSVRLALGLNVDLEPKWQRGAAIRFITSPRSGVISNLDVDDLINDIPGISEVELYLKEGDSISIPHSSNDRIGHVVCVGESAQAASESAERALSFVRFELALD